MTIKYNNKLVKVDSLKLDLKIHFMITINHNIIYHISCFMCLVV